jgi:hypothetical protein
MVLTTDEYGSPSRGPAGTKGTRRSIKLGDSGML